MTFDHETANAAPKLEDKRSRPSLQRLLSVQEAGTVIGLGQWRIRALIYRGELPYVRLGRRILVDIRDIEALIEANKQRERSSK
jgi:excisionase family DNA binding protein